MSYKCAKCQIDVTDKVVGFSRNNYDGMIYCYDCQKDEPRVSNPDVKKDKKDWSDDIINYETLLNRAHELAIKNKCDFSVSTELINHDMEKKFAVVKATVKLGDSTFQAYGDADQENCGDLIKPHFLRMAETRAIARALRWATNNAATAEEEK